MNNTDEMRKIIDSVDEESDVNEDDGTVISEEYEDEMDVSFSFSLSSGNEAFGDYVFEAASETARILSDIAEQIRDGEQSGDARDSNGETVGQWNFSVAAGSFGEEKQLNSLSEMLTIDTK